MQDSGAALLLDGHVELVARAGADGAHLTGIAAHGRCPAVAETRPHRRRRRTDDAARSDGRRRSRARITCCSANPMRTGSGLRWRRSPSACNGGTNCSSRPASALPRRARRPANLRQPARISCWSAISLWADPRGAEAALIDAGQAIEQAHAAASGNVKAGQDNAGHEDPASHIDRSRAARC